MKEKSGVKFFYHGVLEPVLYDNPHSFLGSLWIVPRGHRACIRIVKDFLEVLYRAFPPPPHLFTALMMITASLLPVVGLDVSKATLAVCYQADDLVKHLEVRNNKAGFQQLVKACGAQCRFVMEATGTCNLAVAYYLHEQGGEVAVLNPLVIKRFIQMHLSKGKSDRKDARWLLRYGQQQPVKVWQPDETVLVECRQLEQVNEQLLKQKTMVSNSLEALQRQPVISRLVAAKRQAIRCLYALC